MTDLAYMVREDWAQSGTAMGASSDRIREWLGEEPYLFAVTDLGKLNDRDNNADLEVARYISPGGTKRLVCNIVDLAQLGSGKRADAVAGVVVHPFGHRDTESLRSAFTSGALRRLFVMVWSPMDAVRPWLDGCGAVDLHVGTAQAGPDPLMMVAAKMMVNEEYNGLSSGRGKDAVIQLLRAFSRSGYPLNETLWLQAFFAAGGSFRHADSISRFIREMKSGIKHRTRSRYRDDIVEILREEVAVPQ